MKEWNTPQIWSNTMTLHRNDYTATTYRNAYRDCNQHYSYKHRTDGGWIFFEFANDYDLWTRQR